jgi:AcrR family transcriptional regulator
MDDVAASAGASRALVYHYFGGKQELYLEALRRAAQQLTALIGPGGDGAPADGLAGALCRYFGDVEDHAAGYLAIMGGHTGVAGPMGPAGKIGKIGKIGEGVRQVVLESILKALGVAVPGPVLRVTLRCWLAFAEAAGLDWLANRDLPRDTLERILTEQLVALLRVAATRGAQITALLERLLADA